MDKRTSVMRPLKYLRISAFSRTCLFIRRELFIVFCYEFIDSYGVLITQAESNCGVRRLPRQGVRFWSVVGSKVIRLHDVQGCQSRISVIKVTKG